MTEYGPGRLHGYDDRSIQNTSKDKTLVHQIRLASH